MLRAGLHVYAREGLHHSGHAGLPGARLRQDRFLRSRHRRTAHLDRATHRNRRERAAAAAHARHACVADSRPPGSLATAESAHPMRRLRRTKVVATLGPASGNAEMIARLFEAGADVFRINMSHTSHDRMRELVAAIRSVETSHNRPIGILVDLQGPKLRVGAFANGPAMLDSGGTFTFDGDQAPGAATRV